jgi:hypothetical protein
MKFERPKFFYSSPLESEFIKFPVQGSPVLTHMHIPSRWHFLYLHCIALQRG